MLWYTSFASSILWKFHIAKSRSSITLHDEHFSDIDHWLYFKSHFTSHIRYIHIDISIEVIIFIVVHFSIMCAHAVNIFTIQKSKTIYNYYSICVWKLNMNTSFTFRLSAWSIVRIFLSIIVKYVIFCKNYVVTNKFFNVHIEWIWRYMIRLGISFDILWTGMRIFSCHVTRRSHDRSTESRSFIILHDQHLDDIDDCARNH